MAAASASVTIQDLPVTTLGSVVLCAGERPVLLRHNPGGTAKKTELPGSTPHQSKSHLPEIVPIVTETDCDTAIITVDGHSYIITESSVVPLQADLPPPLPPAHAPHGDAPAPPYGGWVEDTFNLCDVRLPQVGRTRINTQVSGAPHLFKNVLDPTTGIVEDDELLRVDGECVRALSHEEVTVRLRCKCPRPVVTVRHTGNPRDITHVRNITLSRSEDGLLGFQFTSQPDKAWVRVAEETTLSPAARTAGMRPNDAIMAVNGLSMPEDSQSGHDVVKWALMAKSQFTDKVCVRVGRVAE